MQLKRKKRPHVAKLPIVHAGYRIEVWQGNELIDSAHATDDCAHQSYSDVRKNYPKCDVLLFEVLRETTEKYVPISPQQMNKKLAEYETPVS